MSTHKSRVFPIVITVIILIIIIYLFMNVKQPYVECSNTVTDSYGIKIKENLTVNLDSRKIKKIDLTKTIILPDEYLNDDGKFLDTIRYALKDSYEYLDDKDFTITKEDDRIVVHVTVDEDQTLILNNISFEMSTDDSLRIKIISNTKDSNVITLNIDDNYSEGELMTHLKNNGYSCK